MINRVIFIFTLFFCGVSLLAQDESQFPIRITDVLVFGNERTREEVILREIPFDFPAELDMEDLQVIQNRLQNLLLFNRVELGILGEPESYILTIQVTEFFYIYPVPLLFINDRDWGKVSYGFSLTHANFRGLNEKLTVGGWLGYNPAFFLRYHNPWLGKKSRFILGFSMGARKVQNKLSSVADSDSIFNESHLGTGFTLGRRLTLHTSIQANFYFQRIAFPEPRKHETVSGTGVDLIPKVGFHYLIDHRDVITYPRKGYMALWSVTRAGFTSRQPNFWRFNFDHRLYFKLTDRISIGGRNLLKVNHVLNNGGELPTYDRIFIGFLDRIRGYFNRTFPEDNLPANNIMMQFVEARIDLVPIRYFTWKDAPFLGEFFKQLKYGLSLGLFADTGIAWHKSEEFGLKRFFTGFGAGLHFHVPYAQILRLDYAINDRGKGELIFEVGVVF